MSDVNAIETAIHSHLVSIAGITSLVSDRVFAARLEQGSEMPAIMFRRVSGPRFVTHDTTGSYCKSRFEMNIYGASYADAVNLGRVVSSLFDNFRGTMGTGVDTHDVDRVEIGQPRDNWDDDLKRHRRQFDAIFHHRES